MKKSLLILVLPFAQFATVQTYAEDNVTTSGATKTRVEVREELKAAARSGELQQVGEGAPAAISYRKPPAGTATRVQLREETKAAARAGALPKTGENASVEAINLKSSGTKSRAEVKAETRRAIKDKAIVSNGKSYAGN